MANFDASHELEELLEEDNPLKAKVRKDNQDNLSIEMRQMEEQWVHFHMFSFAFIKCDLRFTSYDFNKMQRWSYYPHNHLIFTATATSSGLASSRPGTPANDLRVENRIEGHDM
jgi:serine/threonine kinase 32